MLGTKKITTDGRTDGERTSDPPYMKKNFFFLQNSAKTHKIDDRQPTHFEIQRFATSITNISKNVQLALRPAWDSRALGQCVEFFEILVMFV